MVRKSQFPPQAPPNKIVSVAWPNGMTCPCPQELVSSGHPLLPAGTIGSVNVMLTGTVVAAMACEANAEDRSSRAPEASRARTNSPARRAARDSLVKDQLGKHIAIAPFLARSV